VVVKKGIVLFYKDQKHARSDPESHYKNEPSIVLKGSEINVAASYSKKKHVFQFKAETGAEFLFQAKDDAEMNLWIEKVLTAKGPESDPSSSGRSQTMPAGPSGKKEDSKKKGGMFTMKKK